MVIAESSNGFGRLLPYRVFQADDEGMPTDQLLEITSLDLLSKYALPTDEEIRDGLSGNICRCTGYQHIVAALRAAVAAREEG